MEIGNKIKQLRYRLGLTQEQLAARLNISPQSISKWETSVTMPDITLLPLLAGELGVSIDELFDLTAEQKLRRIESRIESEEEFSSDIFKEYEDFLKQQLAEHADRARVVSLLAHLYHHRMEADAQRVKKYAHEAILLRPEAKDCQWLLQLAEGQYPWDWNVENHSKTVDFYREVIARDGITPKTTMPYYYIIDNLIADHRADEAEHYLELYRSLPAHKPFLVPIYRAHIALARYDERQADTIIETALSQYAQNSQFLFEVAQYHAKKCEYDAAIDYYERSWKLEQDQTPRYTDALQGIATIYEIMGKYHHAVAACDRILECLKTEWGFSDDDRSVIEVEREKARLLALAANNRP